MPEPSAADDAVTERSPRVDDGRRGRLPKPVRVLAAVLLSLVCAAGGALGVGSVWVSERADQQWSVQTRVLPQSQVEIPTSIGTAVFDTHAWGPGARVEVSALALPPVGRRSDSAFIDIDSQIADIQRLATDALVATAWKAAAGALAGGLLGGLLWMAVANRPRRTWRRLRTAALVGVTGAGLCLAGWGAGSVLTFDQEYGDNLEAEGLLAVGLSADRLLERLNSRDQQYAGYVQSLATYISRLRDNATPDRSTDVAMKVMLVSDVHGRNIYPQLAQVIESQGVDLVIDSGDLVQWGTGFELRARPDLQAGIESLGVPYLFAKGNHDSFLTTEALKEIPNVRILDSERVEVDGLGVFGVPDPRLYQDGGPIEAKEPEAVEEMEREAAQNAVTLMDPEAGPVDIAVMHHPAGARELGEELDAPVWVSGHTHNPALEVADDHVDITVGTTGAAGIRTFNSQSETGDVLSTPQSFDILGFNSVCEPVALTRFSYPDSLSSVGNALVTYQTLRLEAAEPPIEGAGEEPTPAEEDEAPERTCG